MTDRTERLTIESLGVEHAEELFGALDDVRVGRFIGGPDVTTLDALVERIEHVSSGAPEASGQLWLNWAVLLDEGHRVIGRIEATVHDGMAEIAYVLGPRWWGHGYASEATAWLLGTLSERADVDQICATVDPSNAASIRLLDRLGMRRSRLPASGLLSYDDGDIVYVITIAEPPTGDEGVRIERHS